jgi:RNA polymerase sigma-70 factor (ECF subfamily)
MSATMLRPRTGDDEATDAALVARAAIGDRRAFDELYRRHVDMVYRRLTRLVGPVPERDDLAQEVFVDLYKALPSFRGEAAFGTFVYRVVVNIAYEHLARLTRQRNRTTSLEPAQLEELVALDGDPEARTRHGELLAEALELLSTLTPEKRIAFVLRVVEGLPLEEIGVLVGASAAAVGQRVKFAEREMAARRERTAKRNAQRGRS